MKINVKVMKIKVKVLYFRKKYAIIYNAWGTLYLVLGKHTTRTQFKANKKTGGVKNDKGKKTRNYSNL